MTDVDQVAEGRRAWAELHRATDFVSWKAIAVALAIGRQQALRVANANRPFGPKYARAFNSWLDANGFREMPYNLRAACCKLADNIAGIETWRASLTEKERASQNHPEVIFRRWRRAMKPTPTPRNEAGIHLDLPSLRHVVQSGKQTKVGRAIHWPQDAIRNAATAMRESRSTDWYALARICLEAAVPDAVALLELLPLSEPTTAKPLPAEMALAS